MEAPHADSLPQTTSPPPAPRKWLRRIVWTLLWSATVLFLAISLFDAYCKHRYEASVAKAKAAGMPESWDEIMPKPVPEADNFGALEDFKPFLAIEEIKRPISPSEPFGRTVRSLDEKGMEALKGIKPLKISSGSLKSAGPFQTASLSDLRSKALADKRLGEDSSGLSDSEALLKVFEDLDPLWKRLHEAKQRKHAVLFYTVRPSVELMVNRLINPMLSLTNIAQIKARAHISASRGNEALEECLLAFKLADLEAFPTLIEHLVRTTQIGIVMPVLYEGVSARVWNDSQLAVLEENLARYGLLGSLTKNVASESLFCRSMNAHIQPVVRTGGEKAIPFLGSLVYKNDGSQERLLPKGPFLIKVFAKSILNIIGSANLDSLLQLGNVLDREVHHNLRSRVDLPAPQWGPLNGLALRGTTAFSGIIKASARGQTLLNIARVAIALERHRLRHGSFPPTLDALAPDFLPSIPTEVFDGAPLHYLLKGANQGFTLYSTGWKGTDDGGAMDYSKPNETNWTWSSP
ncbi:MAG: hypothetical protein DVB28_001812 [Verrucomicrobia bacterium]|nr:MAG: hypothetical protein DVB28_001812 [Verrucomicrobiota bacterium]